MPAPYQPASGRPIPRYVGDLLIGEYISATCRHCGHQGDVHLDGLVDREGPDVPLGLVCQRLVCSECLDAGRRSPARFPPSLRGVDPKARPSLTLRSLWRLNRRRVGSAVAAQHLREDLARIITE